MSDLAKVDPSLPARFANPERIGRGSQGETWRAHDMDNDRDVAVKVFDLGKVRDWKAFELFERECKVLRSIDHPNVPKYYEDFADEKAGRYYLVMELVEGRSLAQDIEDTKRRNTEQLADLLRQLLGVLEYLHDLHPRVVHRDIKPGNVIVRADGSAVLVDFGAVARPFQEKGGSTMIGSFGYMAPEQLHGESGPRTDLYSLGATITAVAASAEGEDLPRKGLRIDLPRIFDPGPLGFTLAAMLEPDPDNRPPSATAARQMLDAPPAPPQPMMMPPPHMPMAALPPPPVPHPTSLMHQPDAELVIPASMPRMLGGMIAAGLLGIITRSPLLFIVGLTLFTVLPGILAGYRRAIEDSKDAD